MKRGYALRFKLHLQALIPGFFTAILIIAGGTNFQLSGASEFIPSFAVMAIFFWVIYGPRFMPQWLCFLLGILEDAVNGEMLGVSAVINLALWGAIHSQRRFLIKENFSVLYGIFIIASLGAALLHWIIFSVANARLFFAVSIPIQWFFTICLYPLLHLVFSHIYLAMVRNFRYIGWR